MGYAVMEGLDRFNDLSQVPPQRQLRDNELLKHLRKAVGFRYVAVGGLDLNGYQIGRGRSIESDMPPAYVETYFSERWNRSDPLVVRATAQATPMTDEEAFDVSAPAQRLCYLHRSYDIGRRLHIPVHRGQVVYGGVCITRDRAFTAGEREFLVCMAEPLHRAISKPLMDRFAADVLRLTCSELHCLELASSGFTSEEISGVEFSNGDGQYLPQERGEEAWRRKPCACDCRGNSPTSDRLKANSLPAPVSNKILEQAAIGPDLPA